MATGLFNLKQVNQAISQGAWSGYIAPRWVEYLVVAGGGAGGSRTGGGGGAGGLLTGIVTVAAGTSYTVTVGAGATGAGWTTQAPNGSNSVFGSISSLGGGGAGAGGNGAQYARSGGSGGGGGGTYLTGGAGGQGTAGQGNAGGTFGSSTSNQSGGGGAGTVGLNGSSSITGNGGAGIASAITGTVVTYAGGGGAGSNGGTAGTGGVGGGANGTSTDAQPSGASNNTGGGGGGGGYTSGFGDGGSGGSGIVVVRYPGNVQFYTGGTVTYSNGYIVHNFTANGTLAPTTPTVVSEYQISRSLRFNSADSPYLSRTPSTTSSQTTATFSAWVKRSRLGSAAENRMFAESTGSGAGLFWVIFTTSDQLQVLVNGSGTNITSTQVFRDPSAWYHIVAAVDTNQAIASDRIKLYVNGTQITAFTGTQTYYTQGQLVKFNVTSTTNYIGYNNSQAFDGYMTEVNWIDGQQLTPTSFGYVNPTTGIWSPAKYVGAYGTNGAYLNFSDNSNTTAATLGKDYSGNGNNWTPNNFSVTAGAGNDSLVDSPTSYGTDTGVGGTVRGNYATLNPLDTNATLSNGNLQAVVTDSPNSDYLDAPCTIGISSGAFYFECVPTAITSNVWCGITNTSASGKNHTQVDASRLIYDSGGDIRDEAGTVTTVASYTTNDVISVAFDRTDGTVKFYKNGTQVYTVTNSKWQVDKKFLVAGRGTWTANFGQRPFAYTAPSGFKALCTQNLPTPTIGATTATLAGKYFNTITWTGTGSGSTRSLTGVGFQPDWVWTKSRSAGYDHQIYDAVRGAGSTKSISSNSANSEAQGNVALYGYVSAFNSDGFTGTNGTDGTIPSAYYNQSGQTYVAWNWKESVTAGFDVVTYTGTGANRTVAHNLGVAPKMIIVKATNLNAFWQVYNADVGATKTMYLNATNAATTDSTSWNNTAPTSSVFTVGTNSDVNSNAISYVAYCFAEVAGYSKFGSYNGTGSADGPFIFTGFKPAYVMVKLSSGGADWIVEDGTRNPYNVVNAKLSPNTSGAEFVDASAIGIDFLSNGFKLRGTDGAVNNSAQTYIFMAFASAPLKFSLAR